MPKCTFCNKEFEEGTGKMFVKTDAKVLFFCSRKCEKNMLDLKRKSREQKWCKE
jgi:large subunit ribosomal protein L24e